MVNQQKKHGFNKLRLNNRTPYRYNWFTGENRRALRNGPYVADELEIEQILQKLFTKAVLGTKVCNIFKIKFQVFQVVNQLFDAGHDSVSAAVRDGTEKHVEANFTLTKSANKVTICHG